MLDEQKVPIILGILSTPAENAWILASSYENTLSLTKEEAKIVRKFDGWKDVREVSSVMKVSCEEILSLIKKIMRKGLAIWLDELSPLFWCYNCNLPLFDSTCSICGDEAQKVILKFPANPRPVFKEDLKRIGLFLDFKMLERTNTLLNHYIKRDGTYGWEVILNGYVVGDLLYNREKRKWEFLHGFPPSLFKQENSTSLRDIIDANSDHITLLEQEAIQFIRTESEKFENKPLVYFSGGKDSTIILYLCELTGINMNILWINTGLEHPEVIDFVQKILKAVPFDKIIIERKDMFWKYVEKFGPPTTNFKWCGKILKFATLKRHLKKVYGESKFLSVGGCRRREEPERFSWWKVSKNKYFSQETFIQPIIEWSDLEVWLYIWSRNLPQNPLYELGFERVACWMCPGKEIYEFDLVKSRYPELWKRYEIVIEKWKHRFIIPNK